MLKFIKTALLTLSLLATPFVANAGNCTDDETQMNSFVTSLSEKFGESVTFQETIVDTRGNNLTLVLWVNKDMAPYSFTVMILATLDNGNPGLCILETGVNFPLHEAEVMDKIEQFLKGNSAPEA